ncbi:MAG: hypothetical protein MZU84_08590 [Sphingobacterium sp.]|nr:hypothetical protein [Sphingobacterium sp.]
MTGVSGSGKSSLVFDVVLASSEAGRPGRVLGGPRTRALRQGRRGRDRGPGRKRLEHPPDLPGAVRRGPRPLRRVRRSAGQRLQESPFLVPDAGGPLRSVRRDRPQDGQPRPSGRRHRPLRGLPRRALRPGRPRRPGRRPDHRRRPRPHRGRGRGVLRRPAEDRRRPLAPGGDRARLPAPRPASRHALRRRAAEIEARRGADGPAPRSRPLSVRRADDRASILRTSTACWRLVRSAPRTRGTRSSCRRARPRPHLAGRAHRRSRPGGRGRRRNAHRPGNAGGGHGLGARRTRERALARTAGRGLSRRP